MKYNKEQIKKCYNKANNPKGIDSWINNDITLEDIETLLVTEDGIGKINKQKIFDALVEFLRQTY